MIGIGQTLNQRFTLEKELGRGGMGAVFRATDQVLGRSVAIKTLKEGGGEVGPKIRLEAQILARLLHENVVRLYDFGESDGVYFLVMEEVDGSSFSKRWRSLPFVDRLAVNAQVAEALDYAHHQGVIHRDVKPANVLLTASDQAKLSDFGLSVVGEDNDESGTVRGTPHYMSPEQARARRLDHRTDLYSLGVMLYECATGSIPFTGKPMEVIAQHAAATPTPPRFKNPGVSEPLESLILSLLSKGPEQRPLSGAVVARAIRDEIDRQRERERQGRGATAVAAGTPEPAADFGGSTLPTVAEPPSGPDWPTQTAEMSAPANPPAEAPTVVRSLVASTVPPVASPLARGMLETVLAAPLMLTPEERYLCGHYLAYLLGGARRQGLFLRRPRDGRNADRARLVLAMAWLSTAGASEENVARAAELLDSKVDVRPALNPAVVMKFLAGRGTPARRKQFRAARKQLQAASRYAGANMLDAKGNLNPGLIPQGLDDFWAIAPERDDVDDQLVARWNRVTEVWRDDADFRGNVLRYATQSASRDPASPLLWPEVVYPLIERARWQRRFRPRHERVWDYLGAKLLHVPAAGVRLDRAIIGKFSPQIAGQIDADLAGFAEDPGLAFDAAEAPAPAEGDDRLTRTVGPAVNLGELTQGDGRGPKGLVRLNPADPFRFTQAELRDLLRDAVAALRKPGGAPRNLPVGPYRLAVVPSVRGRSAGQVVLQGMRNKQIEMLTPSIQAGGSGARPVVAAWVYEDASAALAYLDFRGGEKFILWHAPNAHQANFDHAADLNHELDSLGMEVPDQLDRVLSKRFKPSTA